METLETLRSAPWLLSVAPIFEALEGEAGRTRAVGGIVRDTVLGIVRPNNDIDLATELTPDDVMRRAVAHGISTYPTGIDHGTITLVAGDTKAEVTTLRRDVETFGRHARVVFGTDWREDAERRDFTMNALYCGADGTLFDPLGGLDDCLSRRVQFIGDASQRIAEDRLRVYRYFRFVATHGREQVNADAIAACRGAIGNLGYLSAERVGSEMMRLLGASRCAATLRCMREIGIADVSLLRDDAIAALARLETLQVVITPELRLAVMVECGVDIEHLRSRWRLSNAQVTGVLELVAALELVRAEEFSALAYRFGQIGDSAIVLAGALDGHSAGWVRDRRSRLDAMTPLAMPVSGEDLLALGYQPGPELGKELKRLEALWIESQFSGGREALLAKASRP